MSLLLYLIILMNTIVFFFMKTPMTMGLSLLLQTFLIAAITGMNSMSFWFSYILFLIMIGGMLILFTYMSSLTSNQKFKFNKNLILIITLLMILLTTFNNFILLKNEIPLNLIDKNMMFNIKLIFKHLMILLNKLFNWPENKILLLMINYLLLTLFISVKIINVNSGAIRKV
uniref:NADH-ubiquinone oxidoreductase chain 6 n=1 Tax=Corynis lateralis TaxID=1983417 RepID=A0A1W6Q575_9HYME|nr:NADH dehydrogenase subunit 6 [Corynis lateralis]